MMWTVETCPVCQGTRKGTGPHGLCAECLGFGIRLVLPDETRADVTPSTVQAYLVAYALDGG
jgi:hypothetical protein